MNRFAWQDRSFAVALSATAGYVDAIGFLKEGGFFVSFMSGNSTRLAVGVAGGSSSVMVACGLIISFVAGVVIGSLASGPDNTRSRSVLLLVAALLISALIADQIGFGAASIYLLAGAMGAENAVFVRDGDVQIGLTYMTGTLVKFGQRLTRRLQGDRASGWASYLLLWLGLVVGGVMGAVAYQQVGFGGLAVAVVATIALSLYRPAFRKS